MPDYTLTVTASATDTDDLADMLEAAADRIRLKEGNDFTSSGLPSVSGTGANGEAYRFVVTSDATDPDHFEHEGWTNG